MLIILSYCRKDTQQAINLLRWMFELDGLHPRHELLLVAAAELPDSMLKQVANSARLAFSSVTTIKPVKSIENGWPGACNHLFRTAALYVARSKKWPFFQWIEPDCIPLVGGAFDQTEAAYLAAAKPFLGNTVHQPINHLPGNAVYPADIKRWNPWIMQAVKRGKDEIAWDCIRPDLTLRHTADSPLFQHVWVAMGTDHPQTFKDQKSLSILRKDAVFFHRNKDHSLIARLRERRAGAKDAPTLIERMKEWIKPDEKTVQSRIENPQQTQALLGKDRDAGAGEVLPAASRPEPPHGVPVEPPQVMEVFTGTKSPRVVIDPLGVSVKPRVMDMSFDKLTLPAGMGETERAVVEVLPKVIVDPLGVRAKPPIHTYHEKLFGFPDQSALIELWQRLWSEQGWNPIVLGEKDAKKTGRMFGRLLNAVQKLPTCNHRGYENACYLRHLAMAGRDSGVLLDYDVMPVDCPPFSLQNDLTLLEPTRVPCAVWGRSSGYADVVQRFIDYRLDPPIDIYQGKPHVSDMEILRKTSLPVTGHCVEYLCSGSSIRNDPGDGWKKASMIHFSAASLGQRGKDATEKVKVIQEVLAELKASRAERLLQPS